MTPSRFATFLLWSFPLLLLAGCGGDGEVSDLELSHKMSVVLMGQVVEEGEPAGRHGLFASAWPVGECGEGEALGGTSASTDVEGRFAVSVSTLPEEAPIDACIEIRVRNAPQDTTLLARHRTLATFEWGRRDTIRSVVVELGEGL